MSDSLTYTLILDKSKATTEARAFEDMVEKVGTEWDADRQRISAETHNLKARTDEVGSVWNRTKQRLDREMAGVLGTMQAVVSVARSVFTALGMTLDPVQDALIMMISTSLTSMIAIHRTLEASTMGISGVLTIGLSIMAMTMAAIATHQTIIGMEGAKQAMDKSVAVTQSLVGLMNTLTW